MEEGYDEGGGRGGEVGMGGVTQAPRRIVSAGGGSEDMWTASASQTPHSARTHSARPPRLMSTVASISRGSSSICYVRVAEEDEYDEDEDGGPVCL